MTDWGDLMERLDPGVLVVYADRDGTHVGQVQKTESFFAKLAYEGVWVHARQIRTDGVVGDD